MLFSVGELITLRKGESSVNADRNEAYSFAVYNCFHLLSSIINSDAVP